MYTNDIYYYICFIMLLLIIYAIYYTPNNLNLNPNQTYFLKLCNLKYVSFSLWATLFIYKM